MKGNLKKVLEEISSGDLICVEWCDASTGKASSLGLVIDVPVRSWGVFVGLFGSKIKHIVLAQNSFQYSDGLYDLDYTAIPLGWALSISVAEKAHFPAQAAIGLVKSFQMRTQRVFSKTNRPRTYQRRLSTHGRPD